jgi:isopenicillin-N N-acyltransferase like protein
VSLPVVHLDGEPFEQGRQHGAALGREIARNLEVYYERFRTEARLGRDEARHRASYFVTMLRAGQYFDALRGVAAGSRQDLLDLLVLNLRYELLYFQYGILPVGDADGCSSFAVLPSASANGHLLLGENWDWIADVEGAVLHTREPDEFETLSFTEAGIVGGKIGLNSAGLGLAINGLLSTADDWSRPVTPFHVRCYNILRQRSLEAARQVIVGEPRACSTNFVLAQAPDAAVDIEAAPERVCEMAPTDAVLVHTNHFLEPARIGVTEPRTERRPHTLTRLARLQKLLADRAPVTVADVEMALRDHDNYPDSVCRHENDDDPPEERLATVTSAIMDLDARTLWLTDGPPCEAVYQSYALGC